MLAGVATFAVALGLATVLTEYFTPSSVMIPPVPLVEPAPPRPARDRSARSVPHKVQLVSLDFNAAKTYTTLTLEREPDPSQPEPERVWVRTYFFAPDDKNGSTWSSDAVEFRQPFAHGNRATLTATSRGRWCEDPSVPRCGLYAVVEVSTVSAGPALPPSKMTLYIADATSVLVQNR